MHFRFSVCKAGVWIFVFLFVRSVCGFSSSYLSGRFVDFCVLTCKVGVWISVFLLVRLVCGFWSSYL